MAIPRTASFIANLTKLCRRSKRDSDTTHIDAAINHERGLRRRIKLVVVLGAQNAGKSTFIRQVRNFGPPSNESPQDDLYLAPTESVPSLNATSMTANGSPAAQAIFPSHHTEPRPDVLATNNRHPSAVTETPFVVEVTSPHFNVHRLETILTCVHREIGLQRKWFTCFNEVEAIIFLADLSSYDEMGPSTTEGDKPVNCLRDAMSKFEATCTRYPSSLPTIILVLNKMDLFTSKLASSPLSAHFPEYRGARTPAAAAEYCTDRFLSLLPQRFDRRAWLTSAIDGAQMARVLQEIGVFILDHSFRRSNCFF
ncbi:G-protein alpha subunit-domain-containing protein [Mycena polygramma]|nr:G-protein alpha subunit-domain-containing protein [Mycena polygramma]